MFTQSNVKWVKIVAFFLLSIVFTLTPLLKNPVITGDGKEYLSMTISFSNHLSPELDQEDINDRLQLEAKNNILTPSDLVKFGYYEDLNGDLYSYHFWFYSLFNVIPYLILESLGINPLKCFQLTNCILYLLLLYKILFLTNLKNKTKLLLVIISLFSPILLYMNWTHTEVFSYVFLFMGLLNLYENKKKRGMLFSSIAALQNPAISIVPLYILINELVQKKSDILRKNELRSFITLGIISIINIVPYIFYWLNYRQFSLISTSGYSSLDLISFDKIWSLFFDLNSGLIIYVPLLLILFIYSLIKKEKNVIVVSVIILLISLVSATQLNWNSGMMYINRYSVWFIPLLIFGLLPVLEQISIKKIVIWSLLYVMTTGVVTVTCLKEQDYGNYLKFGPVAQFAISSFPQLYNPQHEIFYERSLGYEGIDDAALPIKLSNSDGVRKVMVWDESLETFGYINGDINLSNTEIYRVENNLESKGNDPTLIEFLENNGEDILTGPQQYSFLSGWYHLEEASGLKHRWIDKEASLAFSFEEKGNQHFIFKIASFNIPRTCEVKLNDQVVFNGVIPQDSYKEIAFTAEVLKGTNILSLTSKDGADQPQRILKGSTDERELSFDVNSIIIK
ncbi:hypothetical protein [Paenibacillus marinisediminis]